MSRRIFISGIGTGVGKTLVAAIVAEALEAEYWKPVQAGYAEGTDSTWIHSVLSDPANRVYPERYKLGMPASPHIAARKEGISISVDEICKALPAHKRTLIIEGAGGLIVPLNANEFVADLVQPLKADLLLVSRNYLGSINHSLLTAEYCKKHQLPVMGWIFNDDYLNYSEEIVQWSGFKKIAAIPKADKVDKVFVQAAAKKLRQELKDALC